MVKKKMNNKILENREVPKILLNAKEWKDFEKELNYPKPSSKELKELMKMEGFKK